MAEEKTWHLIAVNVACEAEEYTSALMFELGTTGIVTLEESVDSVKLGAYFDAQAEPEEIVRRIEAEFARAGSVNALRSISISKVHDQDWMQKWKEGFEAIEVGGRLVVAPSWKLPGQTSGRLVIQIDPGMAFGTGTHETTRLCLELMVQYWRGDRLLDVGTGTGILAIAAARLHPGSHVTAIDVDPLAVEVARENVQINGVAESVIVIEGQPHDVVGDTFDMVVANLTAEVITRLMDDLVRYLAPSGILMLSGILTSLICDVEHQAIEAGLMILERREAGEWAAMVAQRGEG